jgi:hypothetical protein
MKNKIEYILKIVSVLSLTIFVFSIVRSYFFFNQFGVDFGEYINFKDIPRYVIKDFIIYLPPIVLAVMTMIFTYYSPYNTMDTEKPVGALDYFHLYWRQIITWTLLFTCLVLLYYNNPLSEEWMGRIYDYYLMLIPLYTIFLGLIILKKIDKGETKYSNIVYGVLGSILFYLAMVLGVADANEIRRGKNDVISVEFENGSIYSKETGHKYVGRTSQYIFVVDSSEITQILPIGDLKSISIKSRRKIRPTR